MILAVAVTDVETAVATAAACSNDAVGATDAVCSPECDAKLAHCAMVDCLADATLVADAATLAVMPVVMLVAVATNRS